MGFVCVLPMAAAELIQLATVGEDNKGNLSITEDREFISLFEQTIPPLCKCHLTVYLVLRTLSIFQYSKPNKAYKWVIKPQICKINTDIIREKWENTKLKILN